MRTSTALWAAALAFMSVSGPLLTTAEAAPAPQRQTGQKPRYYFPRHIKRQIVTNTTSESASTDPGGGEVGVATVTVITDESVGAATSTSAPIATEIVTSVALVTPVPAGQLNDGTAPVPALGSTGG